MNFGVVFGVLAGLGIVGLVIGLSALGALIVQFLWNFFVPEVFGGPELTFLQTWAGVWLLNLITYGFRQVVKRND